MGTSLAKVRLFCHKVSMTNTLFPLLREMLYAGRMKFFAEASELFTFAVFQLVIIHKKRHSWSASISEPRRWKSEGVKSTI